MSCYGRGLTQCHILNSMSPTFLHLGNAIFDKNTMHLAHIVGTGVIDLLSFQMTCNFPVALPSDVVYIC